MNFLKKIFKEKNKTTLPLNAPYKKNSNLDEILDSTNDFSKISKKIKEQNKTMNDFWANETKMIKTATELYKKKNYEESEKLFKELVESGSKLTIAKENLIKIYKRLNNSDGIEWIKEKIEEQLKDPVDYHHEKSKLNKLKMKYALDFYTYDELWSSFQKQIASNSNFSEHSNIRVHMAEIFLKEEKFKDAIFTIIMAYRDEAMSSYLMDIKLNSENHKRYFDKEYIVDKIRRTVEKTKYKNNIEKIAELVLKQIILIPNDDIGQLKNELIELLD